MPATPLYVVLARLCAARANCVKSGNSEWLQRHTDKINDLCAAHMPHGSGFDSGCPLHLSDTDNGESLRFSANFHHLDGAGFYSGWSEHTVTVRASLVFGFTLSVSGRDRNGIKDYIAETFHCALCAVVAE